MIEQVSNLDPAKTDSDSHPLVSFVLVAYNQEHFIREAVEGAFAQTYSPCEIILSDDCSTDRTFGIMQEMAAAYKGPHIVRLNRNERNLGLVNHCNRIFGMASGELIVGAAGDDISLPQRTERVVQEWIKHGKPAGGLCSQLQMMDLSGILLPADPSGYIKPVPNDAVKILHCWGWGITGAACVWTKSLFSQFGSLSSDLPCEDVPMLWRAVMIGKMIFIPEVLVLWRVNAGGIWSSTHTGKSKSPKLRLALWRRSVQEGALLSQQAEKDTRLDLLNRNIVIRKAAMKYRTESKWLDRMKDKRLGSLMARFLLRCLVASPSPGFNKMLYTRCRIGVDSHTSTERLWNWARRLLKESKIHVVTRVFKGSRS
jgi:glycosyltransferase involved in cell wall biosynthesis